MEFKDRKAWDSGLEKNKDDYGYTVYVFAEKWADLMEAEISSGKLIKDIAQETSHKANTDNDLGLSGFQFQCAVTVLSASWKHGGSLKKWHEEKEAALLPSPPA